MSDISANIVVQPYDITISTTTNTIELSPQVIDMTVVNGYVGATGPTGATGATGLTGATGIQGSTGPVGIGFKTTSTTSLNTSTGTKTLTVGTGLPYVAGQGVLISLDGFSNMYGVVTSYNSANGQMVANIQRFDGSGTHISWVVDLMGLIGATGPDGATGPSGGPTGATGATGATGPGVTVYDEGNVVAANVASIDFVGAGVLANATGNAVTVTISATPAGANYEIQYKDGTVFGATGSLIWDVANNSTKTANLIVDNQITGNTANIAGNVSAGNVKTDNLLYANGTAWQFGQDPGGSNTNIQFNDDNVFAGSNAFTFNKTSNAVTINGILDASNTSDVNLGNVSNVTITGGINGYYLQTDGSGNLGWVAGTANGNGTVGGSNTQVQYNNSGSFGGIPGFTYNNVSNTTTITSVGITTANVSNLNVTNINLTTNKTVIGNGSSSNANNVVIVGSNNIANSNTAIVIGYNNRNTASDSIMIGRNQTAGAINSIVLNVSGINLPVINSNNLYISPVGQLSTMGANTITNLPTSGVMSYNPSDGIVQYVYNILLENRTVANLPSTTGPIKGLKMFVSDANSTTFNAIVGGGGANFVPVFCDGTNWRIG